MDKTASKAEKAAGFLDRVTEWSLYVFLAFFAVSKALVEVSFTTALISWVASKILKREELKIPRDFLFFSLLAFVLLSTASAFVSLFPDESFRGIGKVLEYFFFWLIVADSVRTRERIRNLLLVAAATFLVTALDGLYQLAMGEDLFRHRALNYADNNSRITGPFHDHSLMAAYLLSWISVWMAFLLCPNRLEGKIKVLLGLTIPLGVFCLFHTQARGAWLAFAAAVCFFALIRRHKILLGLLAVAVVAGLAFLPRNMIIHVDAEGKEQSMVERVVLWRRALDVVEARPWLGTGINTYARAHPQFDREQSWRVRNYYAHNSYLQMAAERGVPALFFFFVFVVLFFVKGYRRVRSSLESDGGALLTGLLTALTGLLILALADTVFEPLQLAMLIWFFFGLGTAVERCLAEGKT